MAASVSTVKEFEHYHFNNSTPLALDNNWQYLPYEFQEDIEVFANKICSTDYVNSASRGLVVINPSDLLLLILRVKVREKTLNWDELIVLYVQDQEEVKEIHFNSDGRSEDLSLMKDLTMEYLARIL